MAILGGAQFNGAKASAWVRRPEILLASGIMIAAVLTATFGYFSKQGSQIAVGFASISSVLAAILAFRASQAIRLADQKVAAAWKLVGIAALSWAIFSVGNVAIRMMRLSATRPTWADAGLAVFFLLVLAAVVKFSYRVPPEQRTRSFLDCGITASGLGVIVWNFVIGALAQTKDTPIETRSVYLAQPTLDMVLLFGALFLFVLESYGDRPTWRFVGAGLLLISLTDVGFIIFQIHGVSFEQAWANYLFGVAFGLIAAGCLRAMTKRETYAAEATEMQPAKAEKSSHVVAAFPYVTALTATSIVITLELVRSTVLTMPTVITCGAVLLLVFARQFATMFENQLLTQKVHRESEQNRDLAEELKSLNDNLESIVDTRTRQMNAMNRLTKAVSSSLDVANVLSEAGASTMEAFQAEGIGIWLNEKGQNGDVQARMRFSDGTPHVVMLLKHLPGNASEDVDQQFGFGDYFSVLWAPIVWRGLAMGQVAIGTTRKRFDDDDQQLLDAIAMEVGTALRHAFLYADAVRRADRDSITELYNHRALQQRLDGLLDRCGDTSQMAFVMLIDLDNFKFFNDTYGHIAGDTVLRRVAEAIRTECGPSAYGGRYGGDEFMIVGECMSPMEPKELANRLKARLQDNGYEIEGDDRVVPIGASFGISVFPDDGKTRHDLLLVADQNLYTAKKSPSAVATSSDIQRANAETRSLDDFKGLDGLITSVDNKDRYTRRHSEDVSEYALWIAEEIGLAEAERNVLRITALLHDVGKICIPDEILRKPGRLTDEEYEILKSHPAMGAMIVSVMPGMDPYIPGVKSHHERWDGNGYPDQLVGENIPLMGRILAVADAFSAMTTDRPYRKGMEWDVALGLIEAGSGTQFQPEMATAFIDAVARRKGHLRLAA